MLATLLRNRSLRLAAGLALAVLIPLAVLVSVQLRSLADIERTSAVVLAALSRQTADAIHQRFERDFEQPSFNIERINHLAIERFDQSAVAQALGTSTATPDAPPLVAAYYLWSERGPGGATGSVFELGVSGGRTGAFAPAGNESPRLLGHARAFAARRWPWGSTVETIDGRPSILVLHLLFESSARERVTSFIGFRVDLDHLRREYLPATVSRQLEGTKAGEGLAPLLVEVTDEEGAAIYQSDPHARAPWIDERPVPLHFFDPEIMPASLPCDDCLRGWRIRTSYGGRAVADIARSHTLGQRALLATLVTLALAGLVVVARSAVQQVRLADARSQFVASVSHDLKTPLALIQLFAETLELGRVRSQDRAQEYYGIISREARKLTGFINTVLDFSRIDSGFRMFTLRELDLAALVADVVSRLRPQFEQSGFDVSLDIGAETPPVMADGEAAELAVANLLSNATKYSGEARRIDVHVAREGRWAVVRVADHGIGIPRRLHRKVFEKFFRVEPDGGAGSGGCGLGLAIVDQVMRAHGGRVGVESEPGKGSTFALYFPIPKESHTREQAHSRDRRRASDAAGAA